MACPLLIAVQAIIEIQHIGLNMDYFIIFSMSNLLGLLITYFYLVKKAKIITLIALIKGAWIYGTIISMLIAIPYYLYN